MNINKSMDVVCFMLQLMNGGNRMMKSYKKALYLSDRIGGILAVI